MTMSSSDAQEQAESESNQLQKDIVHSPALKTSKSFLRAFTSLHQRNFRVFWFSQMISFIGSSMQAIGQAWLILQLTHSALQIGLFGAVQALPVLIFSLFGGVIADR